MRQLFGAGPQKLVPYLHSMRGHHRFGGTQEEGGISFFFAQSVAANALEQVQSNRASFRFELDAFFWELLAGTDPARARLRSS